MIRGIYLKIFLWYWVAALGATLAVAIMTFASGSQPLGQRWMSTTADLVARSAVEFYETGGSPALEHYVNNVETSGAIRVELYDPAGRDLLGRGLPPDTEEVAARARLTGRPQYALALRWAAGTPVATPRGTYLLAARVYPVAGIRRFAGFGPFLMKALIALVATALLCLLLARHLARPVRSLQSAARRIADGDWQARATPLVKDRNDEISDLAQDFDRMAGRIQQLIAKQHELLGDISHELRSPLARVNLSLELARRGDASALDRAQKDLDRLDTMIGEILTLTRLHTAQGQRIVSRIALRTLLESIAEDARFEGAAEDKQVVLVKPDECRMEGDPSLVRSALENLVRNAVRYTRPGSTVEIHLDARTLNGRRMACVRVCDSGPGVPPEALSRLFEPFYRADPARDATTGGFGLGLAIAQRVASFYGGAATACNLPQGGLEVTLTFPLAA